MCVCVCVSDNSSSVCLPQVEVETVVSMNLCVPGEVRPCYS